MSEVDDMSQQIQLVGKKKRTCTSVRSGSKKPGWP